MKINVSLSAAEGMIKILTEFSRGLKLKKEEILYFLNEDEGCIKQFKFYKDDIRKNDYVDMIFAVAKNESYETENFILKKMYSALNRIYSNLELLYKKLDNVKQFNFKGFEEKLTSTLPSGTELNINIFFCLDGFNGGSIVDENNMCVDVLFWPSNEDLERSIEGIILHEFHHIGFLYWRNKDERRKNILMNKDKSSLAVGLVEQILSEGAAVYFFNKEQELYELVLEAYGEELAKGFKEGYLESWNNIEDKVNCLNNLLLQLLDRTNDNYDSLKSNTNKYFYSNENGEALNKVIGKHMCSVIEDTLGRQALIDSFINLQNFLVHYNKACEKIGEQGLDIQVLNKWKELW